jgi:hypothetical protein
MKMNKALLATPIFALMLGAVPSSFAQQLMASASPAPIPGSAVTSIAKPVATKPLPQKLDLAAPAPITWTVGSSVGPAPDGAAKPAHTLFNWAKRSLPTPDPRSWSFFRQRPCSMSMASRSWTGTAGPCSTRRTCSCRTRTDTRCSIGQASRCSLPPPRSRPPELSPQLQVA